MRKEREDCRRVSFVGQVHTTSVFNQLTKAFPLRCSDQLYAPEPDIHCTAMWQPFSPPPSLAPPQAHAHTFALLSVSATKMWKWGLPVNSVVWELIPGDRHSEMSSILSESLPSYWGVAYHTTSPQEANMCRVRGMKKHLIPHIFVTKCAFSDHNY